jgi:hypothetical protein
MRTLLEWFLCIWIVGVALIFIVERFTAQRDTKASADDAKAWRWWTALWPFYGATMFVGTCMSIAMSLTIAILAKLGRLDLLSDAVQHKVDAFMLRHVGKLLRRPNYVRPTFIGEHSAKQASEALVRAFNIRARVEATSGTWLSHEHRTLFTVVWPDQEEDVSGAQHYLCGFADGYRYAALDAQQYIHSTARTLASMRPGPEPERRLEWLGSLRALHRASWALAGRHGMTEIQTIMGGPEFDEARDVPPNE